MRQAFFVSTHYSQLYNFATRDFTKSHLFQPNLIMLLITSD